MRWDQAADGLRALMAVTGTIHVATQVADITACCVGTVTKAARRVLGQIAVEGVPRRRRNYSTVLPYTRNIQGNARVDFGCLSL